MYFGRVNVIITSVFRMEGLQEPKVVLRHFFIRAITDEMNIFVYGFVEAGEFGNTK